MSLGVRKPLKKLSKSTYITTCYLGEFQEKLSYYPSSSKNNLQCIQLSDTTGTSNETGFYDQMKLKHEFLAANTQDGFGEHKDKKYPMCTMTYTAVFVMLWAYISAGGPGHLV